MKKLILSLIVTISLPMFANTLPIFATSFSPTIISKLANVQYIEQCDVTLELRIFPAFTTTKLKERYSLTLPPNSICNEMIITVNENIQRVDLTAGAIVNFSDEMMEAYLNSNTITVGIYTEDNIEPTVAYYIEDDSITEAE